MVSGFLRVPTGASRDKPVLGLDVGLQGSGLRDDSFRLLGVLRIDRQGEFGL